MSLLSRRTHKMSMEGCCQCFCLQACKGTDMCTIMCYITSITSLFLACWSERESTLGISAFLGYLRQIVSRSNKGAEDAPAPRLAYQHTLFCLTSFSNSLHCCHPCLAVSFT